MWLHTCIHISIAPAVSWAAWKDSTCVATATGSPHRPWPREHLRQVGHRRFLPPNPTPVKPCSFAVAKSLIVLNETKLFMSELVICLGSGVLKPDYTYVGWVSCIINPFLWMSIYNPCQNRWLINHNRILRKACDGCCLSLSLKIVQMGC